VKRDTAGPPRSQPGGHDEMRGLRLRIDRTPQTALTWSHQKSPSARAPIAFASCWRSVLAPLCFSAKTRSHPASCVTAIQEVYPDSAATTITWPLLEQDETSQQSALEIINKVKSLKNEMNALAFAASATAKSGEEIILLMKRCQIDQSIGTTKQGYITLGTNNIGHRVLALCLSSARR